MPVLPEPAADGPDHGVEAGAVAAAGEHPDPHRAASLASVRGRRFGTVGAGAGQARMLTARAATSSSVTSETVDWISISCFAVRVSGIVSVGLNALAFVNET